MNLTFAAILGFFLLVYGTLNYYIGSRFLQAFSSFINPHPVIYWLVVAIFALSPFLARMVRRETGSWLIDRITAIGDYWLAVFFYSLILWALADVLRLVSRTRAVAPPTMGLGVVVVLMALLIYGSVNARAPRVTRHTVTIDKSVEGLSDLKAVMVSDVHLGTTVNNRRLADMVNRINALQPDIVFLAGDIIDGDISEFAEEEMPRILRQLTPRLGSYAVLGNHENMRGGGAEATRHLVESGITVLVDEFVKVSEQFYVVGRNDVGMHGRTNAAPNISLAQVMSGIDHNLPIILLDHQPSRLNESLANRVDLQFSGHTHHGQLFPNNFITGRIFEVDWGYLKKETLQVIVSCGFGTWGPPIRVGSYSEIVEIVIEFRGQ